MRAWLATHQPRWMTPRRLKLATGVVLAAGVLASGSHMAPNGPGSNTAQATSSQATAAR
jgi:hypothetical protein